MKNVNLKRLVLSTAIIGASSLAFSAVAEQSGSANNYDARQSESQSVTTPDRADRNITNPNTEGYSSTNSSERGSTSNRDQMNNSRDQLNSGRDQMDSTEDRSISATSGEADVDETVHFEPNSVTLNESAEMQLEKVVEQIDKDKPVALTVEIQGSTTEGDMTSPSSATSGTTMNQDSSAGFPSDERGVAGARVSPTERGEAGIAANSTQPSNNAEALESEQQDRAQLISRYRAENIRQYLERQGVTVVQWEMEGGVSGAASGETTDTGFATRNQAGGADAQQSGEDIQQVRIVIVGDVSPEGLSAL